MAKISFSKVKTELKEHWNTPDATAGKFISWKEHLQIFFGIGANYMAQVPLGFLGFGAGCFLIMYHYRLPYLAFSTIGLIGIPLSYLWSIIAWVVADNLGFMEKKTEKKVFSVYITAAVIGLTLILTDPSKLMDSSTALFRSIEGIEGISMRSFFKIFGIQLLMNGYGGLRSIITRKIFIPKYGRCKFFLYSDVIQKCVLIALFGWLPIWNIQNVDERVWLAYLLFSVYGLFNFGNGLENAANLSSTNSEERLFVRCYTVKIAHVFNSILAAVVPVIAKTVGGFESINFFRFVIPGMFIGCAVVTMISAKGIKERIPQPPIEKKQQIPFWYGIFEVMKNKYNWLNFLYGTIDALGSGAIDITTVIYLYTLRLSGLEYSLIGLLWTFRFTIPTFIAPKFVKLLSFKKWVYIRQFAFVFNCVASLLALFFLGNNSVLCGIILFATRWISDFARGVPEVARSDMDLRLKDYQMFRSGERLESFTGVFGWFGSPITTLVGLIIPIILLNSGFNSNWDILFLDSARFNILAIPFIFDLVGHLLMIIPMIFWDYNKDQHEYVIDVLLQREKLAEEGYFPQDYTGGLDFDKPTEIKNGMPADLTGYIDRKQAKIKALKEAEHLAKEAAAAEE